jgi:FkbM family methyltransferase
MQRFRTNIRIFLFYIINNLIKLKPFMELLNYVFERTPYSVVELINRHVVIPNKQFDWTIKLYNGENVVTRIRKDNEKTMHVAIGYKWHDRGLNILEDIMVNFLNKNHNKNSIFIDCGANMGMRSLTALSKNMKVVMFEPNDETNQINLERCRMNNFTNYELLTFGVSDKDEQKKFYFDSSSYLSTLNADIAGEDNIKITNVMTIEVRKLDTIFSNLIGTNTKAYIKMDIEGHEIEALSGADELIDSISPTLMIEINEKNEHIQLIFNRMRNKGYTIFEKSEPDSFNKFLTECPINVLDTEFISNDFLFVKDLEIVRLIKPYTN